MATGGEEGDKRDHISKGEHYCGKCSKGDQSTEASHYCPECDQCYCRTCLCDHDVIGRSGIKRWGNSRQHVLDDMCPKHDTVKVELYCKDHDVVFCSVCLSTIHRSCVNVVKLSHIKMGTSLRREEQKGLQDDIKTLVDELETLHNERIIKESVMEKSHYEYISKVKEFRCLVNETFDNISKRAEELKRRYDEKCASDQMILKNSEAQLVKLREVFEHSKEQTHPFSVLKKWKEWARLQKKLFREMRGLDIKSNFKLISNEAIQQVVSEIAMMDEVQLINAAFAIIQEDDTKVCEIVGICQLGNGNIILADASNRKLKLLDDTYTMCSSYQLKYAPVALVVVSETEVAVTNKDRNIQLVNVAGTTISTTTSFRLKFIYSAIGSLNKKLFFVCVDANDRVDIRVLDKTGGNIRTYRLGKLYQIAGDIVCLALSRYTGELYVTINGTLFLFDSNGNLLDKYTSSGHQITSMCLDDAGSIYMSGFCNNMVVTVKRDCKGLSKISEQHFEKPWALCWDRRIGRLVVACQKGNFIHVV